MPKDKPCPPVLFNDTNIQKAFDASFDKLTKDLSDSLSKDLAQVNMEHNDDINRQITDHNKAINNQIDNISKRMVSRPTFILMLFFSILISVIISVVIVVVMHNKGYLSSGTKFRMFHSEWQDIGEDLNANATKCIYLDGTTFYNSYVRY